METKNWIQRFSIYEFRESSIANWVIDSLKIRNEFKKKLHWESEKNTLRHLIGSSSRWCTEHNRIQWKFKRNYELLSSHSNPSNHKPFHRTQSLPVTLTTFNSYKILLRSLSGVMCVCVRHCGVYGCYCQAKMVSWDSKTKQCRRVFDSLSNVS